MNDRITFGDIIDIWADMSYGSALVWIKLYEYIVSKFKKGGSQC